MLLRMIGRLLMPILNVVGAGKAGVGDGTALATTGVREGKTGEQIFGQAHGKYYEAASRGNLYAGGNATKRGTTTALSTTGPITLYNPVGSGKLLSIKRVGFGIGETGTLGTGGLFHCVYTFNGPVASQTSVLPTGTAITPKNCRVDLANSSVATFLENVTFQVAPVALALFLNVSEVATGTIGGNCTVNFEDVDGSIVLAPGGGYAIQGITATGSTPVGYFGICWEEIPVS